MRRCGAPATASGERDDRSPPPPWLWRPAKRPRQGEAPAATSANAVLLGFADVGAVLRAGGGEGVTAVGLGDHVVQEGPGLRSQRRLERGPAGSGDGSWRQA